MSQTFAWPTKRRDIHNHHFDSTIWDNFQFRADDIIIASYAKSGTTWLQQIVAQLLWNGAEDINVWQLSPWLDLRVPPKAEKLPEVEAQTHRRFIKTHLPVDALVFSPQAKYLYIARDGRDVVWSLYNHHANATADWYAALNDTPGRVGPPIGKPPESIAEYFRTWLEQDGYPFWSYWENVRSWWEIRHLPNVMLLHYANLKTDMPTQIRQIAAFLDMPIDETQWPQILEHCSFNYMKQHAEQSVPLGGIFWEGGAQTFVHKGTNNRWKDVLSAEDIAQYTTTAVHNLGEDCAHWLETGMLP
ncbi:MAG TPA: sulfotransferase domain-containing protein [Stenomitos sp.]